MVSVARIDCKAPVRMMNSAMTRNTKAKQVDRAISWAEFRKMANEQKLQVKDPIMDPKKGAQVDKLSPTLYLICW